MPAPTPQNPLDREPLRQQFRRFVTRVTRLMHAQPVRPEDINRIHLPAAPDGTRYFADRNNGGSWNVWARTGTLNGAQPHTLVETLIGLDLPLPKALDLMAVKNPAGMQKQTYSHWHPATVAVRIGHRFPADLGLKIPQEIVPQKITPPAQKPRKNSGFRKH